MNILALCSGVYGNRIARHIEEANIEDWTVNVLSLPRRLPLVIDEPDEFLPAEIPRADLVLAMGESAESAQLVPAIAKHSGARTAIFPVDNSAWMPPGLKSQLRDELSRIGVKATFPKTFCTLTETKCGFGAETEVYDDHLIAAFARHFGLPKLDLGLDHGKISRAVVVRSAPCGSTRLVAEKLVGLAAADAVPQAGLHAHHYPCLASMSMEANGETLMHISGHVVNQEVVLRLREGNCETVQ